MKQPEAKRHQQKTARRRRALMSRNELAHLGDGHIAYIRVMTVAEARKRFPAVGTLPDVKDLYALHSADGTPIALTDSHAAAIGHAIGDDLVVASVH